YFLQLKNMLDYDSYEVGNNNFQYTASIIVTDNGKPPLTTTIPIYITVTPVNEFGPKFINCSNMYVNENSPLGTVIGWVNFTDKDWPFNNVLYSITGGAGNNPLKFYIDPYTGKIHVLSHLDYEKIASYTLEIQAVDMNEYTAPDPQIQKTATCTLTVFVVDTNDNSPECYPPYYEETIYSTLSAGAGITPIYCSDTDTPDHNLNYSIVKGNTDSLFYMRGNVLVSRDDFSYQSPGVYDPTTYELLVRVTDWGPPVFSTTVTVIVHVIPWTTTKPTTTVTTTVTMKLKLGQDCGLLHCPSSQMPKT
ncbi:CDHR4 protein, partial [Amia calva]|nr:CDHR4 protein [Amia calva]